MSMTTDDLIQKHWNYYLMLEQKVLETRNYVEFRAENNNTSSNEFGLLIISIGAELDNFLKTYCEIPDGERDTQKTSMKVYADYLSLHYPDIAKEKITVLDTNPVIILSPFALTKPENHHYQWWDDAYDAVKHNRVDNFIKANLWNTLNLLAALYLLEMKMFKNIYDASTDKGNTLDCPLNQSKLFELKEWSFKCSSLANGYFMDTGN